MLLNVSRNCREPMIPRDAAFLDAASLGDVTDYLSHRPGYQPTPLHRLDQLAASLDLGAIRVKDEGHRLGLGSFKALGGAYAVARLVLDEAARRLGRVVGYDELGSTEVDAIASRMTFTCATDGNHGRSVAEGARLAGASCVIFVHHGVSGGRVEAIERYGAQVIKVEGSYDDSVREAARMAGQNGWTIVSDTGWAGHEHVPGLVMQGYTAIWREAAAMLDRLPTHIFIQAGVGGLAATIAGSARLALGSACPTVVVVEPERAACLLQSARAGKPVTIKAAQPTIMAMLECYEPSLPAWRILRSCADAYMAVGEEDAVEAMNLLARPLAGDPPIIAGESGGAGLAGLLRASRDADTRAALGLGSDSRIFLINTEGATDPKLYHELVGADPASIIRGEEVK